MPYLTNGSYRCLECGGMFVATSFETQFCSKLHRQIYCRQQPPMQVVSFMNRPPVKAQWTPALENYMGTISF